MTCFLSLLLMSLKRTYKNILTCDFMWDGFSSNHQVSWRMNDTLHPERHLLCCAFGNFAPPCRTLIVDSWDSEFTFARDLIQHWTLALIHISSANITQFGFDTVVLKKWEDSWRWKRFPFFCNYHEDPLLLQSMLLQFPNSTVILLYYISLAISSVSPMSYAFCYVTDNARSSRENRASCFVCIIILSLVSLSLMISFFPLRHWETLCHLNWFMKNADDRHIVSHGIRRCIQYLSPSSSVKDDVGHIEVSFFEGKLIDLIHGVRFNSS